MLPIVKNLSVLTVRGSDGLEVMVNQMFYLDNGLTADCMKEQ